MQNLGCLEINFAFFDGSMPSAFMPQNRSAQTKFPTPHPKSNTLSPFFKLDGRIMQKKAVQR